MTNDQAIELYKITKSYLSSHENFVFQMPLDSEVEEDEKEN